MDQTSLCKTVFLFSFLYSFWVLFLGLEEVNFQAEVRSMATFQCVRVRSVEEGEDQYAYQTSVNIGGHIFKGILYDQGPSSSSSAKINCYTAGQTSSAGTGDVLDQHPPDFVGGGARQQLQFLNTSSYSFPQLGPSFSGMQFFPNRKS